jgi:hypothetical protein
VPVVLAFSTGPLEGLTSSLPPFFALLDTVRTHC